MSCQLSAGELHSALEGMRREQIELEAESFSADF